MPYIQLLFLQSFIAEYCVCSDVATVEGDGNDLDVAILPFEQVNISYFSCDIIEKFCHLLSSIHY